MSYLSTKFKETTFQRKRVVKTVRCVSELPKEHLDSPKPGQGPGEVRTPTAAVGKSSSHSPSQDRDQRRIERALRVLKFGQENAADFTAGSKALALLTELTGLLSQLDVVREAQAALRVRKTALINAIDENFFNIARTAEAIELDEPGFAAPFMVPANLSRSSRLSYGDALLARLQDADTDTAEAGAAKAALRAHFIAYELPADFVVTLQSNLTALRHAGEQQQSEAQEKAANAAAITRLLDATGNILQRIDAIMNNKYARLPDKLRIWANVIRVERSPRRKAVFNPSTLYQFYFHRY